MPPHCSRVSFNPCRSRRLVAACSFSDYLALPVSLNPLMMTGGVRPSWPKFPESRLLTKVWETMDDRLGWVCFVSRETMLVSSALEHLLRRIEPIGSAAESSRFAGQHTGQKISVTKHK
jgi:hypothetical protein